MKLAGGPHILGSEDIVIVQHAVLGARAIEPAWSLGLDQKRSSSEHIDLSCLRCGVFRVRLVVVAVTFIRIVFATCPAEGTGGGVVSLVSNLLVCRPNPDVLEVPRCAWLDVEEKRGCLALFVEAALGAFVDA